MKRTNILKTGIVLASLALASCAGQKQVEVKSNLVGKTLISPPVPQVVLDGNKNSVRFMKDRSGFWVDKFAKRDLYDAAGLLAGTMKITKTDNGHFLIGEYSPFENPEEYKQAAELADWNNDGAVTAKEARDSLKVGIDTYSKK